MKPKTIYILSTLIVILLLIKCSTDNDDDPIRIDSDKDYAELSIRLGKEASTKANGDIPATEQEKKIESLACFVQTFDEGVIGQDGYKPGAFLKYFTHEDKGSPNGFTDYDFGTEPPTVKIRIYSEGFKDLTQLVFIANYEQNGLKDALTNVNRMEDLAAIRTPGVTTQGIRYPLLMTGNAQAALSAGQTGPTPLEVTLTRIMTRIDIQNNANTGDKPFVMESAQVINPKLYSYLMEGNDDSYNIPVLPDGFTAAQPGATDPDLIEGLYTYETANDGTVEHTAILLRGTLNGEPYTKRIDMQAAGQPVPLGRNKRYLVTLTKTGSSQEITFTFKVADWEDGATFPVQPEHDKPVLNELTFSNGFDNGRWNAAETLYNMENQPSGTITFTVTGKQQISARITEARSHADQSTSNVENMAGIHVSDPIFNNDGTLTQTVTINIATSGIIQNKEPIDLSIQIYNAVKPSYNETIHITNLLNYPGTDLKPVLLGNIYWAPVHVGATEIRHDGTLTLETMGYVYQWGRTYHPTVMKTENNLPTGDEVLGPVTYAEATGVYRNNFIYTSTTDWLTPDDPQKATRDALWTNPLNTPCPAGWQLPDSAQLTEISKVYSPENLRLDISEVSFSGQDGQTLYLPLSGWREYRDGGSRHVRVRSLIWASDYPKTDVLGRIFNLEYSESGCFVNRFNPGYSFFVRCIRM